MAFVAVNQVSNGKCIALYEHRARIAWTQDESLYAEEESQGEKIHLYKGLGGQRLLTMPYESETYRLMEISPSHPNRIFVGTTLYDRKDLRPILTMDNEFYLGPDWKWIFLPVKGNRGDNFISFRNAKQAAVYDHLGIPDGSLPAKLQAFQLERLERRSPKPRPNSTP